MTEYNFFVSDPTDISTKITTITSRINNDVEIDQSNLPVDSVVYNSPDLVITFTSPLSEYDLQLVSGFFSVIFNGHATPDNSYHFYNKTGAGRMVENTILIPTSIDDSNSGYKTGSTIYNPTDRNMYICIDPTANSADWLKLTPTIQNIYLNSGGNLTANNYIYYATQSATETQSQLLINRTGTINNLHVYLGTAPGVGNSRTFTVNVNGSPTSLLLTLSNTTNQGSNTVDTIEVNSGDLLSVHHTVSGVPDASVGLITFSINS